MPDYLQDGARIKVWPGIASELEVSLQGGGGLGSVKNVTYDTMSVHNVDWAIELTQCYGQSNQTLCDEYPSNLTISDIWFKNFSGVTSTKEGKKIATLVCSSPNVCFKLFLFFPQGFDTVADRRNVRYAPTSTLKTSTSSVLVDITKQFARMYVYPSFRKIFTSISNNI